MFEKIVKQPNNINLIDVLVYQSLHKKYGLIEISVKKKLGFHFSFSLFSYKFISKCNYIRYHMINVKIEYEYNCF